MHVLLQINWLAWALRVIFAALATSRASTQTLAFIKFVAAFCSLLLVWFAGDMKSDRPSKDDEQHCCCVVWKGKTFLQSLDIAFSAPSWKSSFLRVLRSWRRRTSTCFASSMRFSHWQSENQEDSRLDRVRIIISDAMTDLALLNAQQIKIVSREACVCAMCSRTGQGFHVSMRAYLRNLLGSASRC